MNGQDKEGKPSPNRQTGKASALDSVVNSQIPVEQHAELGDDYSDDFNEINKKKTTGSGLRHAANSKGFSSIEDAAPQTIQEEPGLQTDSIKEGIEAPVDEEIIVEEDLKQRIDSSDQDENASYEELDENDLKTHSSENNKNKGQMQRQ